MLPGFRQLCAITLLSLSVLVFAFGAAALLRAAHDDFSGLQFWNAGREPGLTRDVARLRAPVFAADERAPAASPSLSVLEVAPAMPDRAAGHATVGATANTAPHSSEAAATPAPREGASPPPETSQVTVPDTPPEAAATPASTPESAAVVREAKAEAEDDITENTKPTAGGTTAIVVLPVARPESIPAAPVVKKSTASAKLKVRRIKARRRLVRRRAPPVRQQTEPQFVNPFEALFGEPFQNTATQNARR